MPLIDVTFPRGALAPERRTALVGALTAAVLRAERAPDTPLVREITWVDLHEQPEPAAFAAGAPVAEPRFRVEVTVPAGLLSERRCAELIDAATRAVADAASLGPEDLLRVWVLVHEVPDGRWGAGGRVVTAETLRATVTAA